MVLVLVLVLVEEVVVVTATARPNFDALACINEGSSSTISCSREGTRLYQPRNGKHFKRRRASVRVGLRHQIPPPPTKHEIHMLHLHMQDI